MADLVRGLLATGVAGVVYDTMVPARGGGSVTVGGLARIALIGVVVGLLPALVALAIARAARAKRAWLAAGVAGAAVALLFIRFGPTLP